jgi:hypothetical protein
MDNDTVTEDVCAIGSGWPAAAYLPTTFVCHGMAPVSFALRLRRQSPTVLRANSEFTKLLFQPPIFPRTFVNCHKLCIIFPFGLRSSATGGRP